MYSFKVRDLENYFSEISTFSDFMNTLRNFVKSVFAHIFAKYKYFAKQFILTLPVQGGLSRPPNGFSSITFENTG